MWRLLKRWFLILVGLVALVVLIGTVLPYVVRLDEYKDNVSQLFKKKTGYELDINGPISWGIFPWLQLKLHDVEILGPHKVQLVHLTKADFSISILPLFQKKIVTKHIELEGVSIALERDKDLQESWVVAKKETKETKELSNNQDKDKTFNALYNGLSLDISGINIKDLNLKYCDLAKDVCYNLEQVHLNIGSINGNAPVDVDARLNLSASRYDASVYFELESEVTLNLEDKNFQFNQIILTAKPLGKKTEEMKLTGNVNVNVQPIKAFGEIQIESIDFKKFISDMKMPLSSTKTNEDLRKVDVLMEFSIAHDQLEISLKKLNLDSTKLSGKIIAENFSEHPSIVCHIEGDDLNLDKYMPKANTQKRDTKQGIRKSSPNAAETTLLIPEQFLRSLDLKGSLSLESLIISDVVFEKPTIRIDIANNTCVLNTSSSFYSGSLSLLTVVNVQRIGQPLIAIDGKVDDVSLSLLSKNINALEMFEGQVNSNIKLSTRGKLLSQMIESLEGVVQVRIMDGVFTQVNFDYLVCQAVASIKKKELSSEGWDARTQFKQLRSTFNIRNGIVSNNDLMVSSSTMNLHGKGRVSLSKGDVDYKVKLKLSGERLSKLDSTCHINEDYWDVEWPMLCTGSIHALEYGVDWDALKDVVADIAKQNVKKHFQGEIKKHIKKKWDGISELFGR